MVFCHETATSVCVSPSPAATATTSATTTRTISKTISASLQPPPDTCLSSTRCDLSGMAGIMLRSLAASLSTERAPLPFGDSGIGCPAWSRSGTDECAPSVGGGKTKHAPETHRTSPYPPLVRSSSGYGSAAGAKRLAAATLAARASQPLRRTASLQGGDSLAALQAAADDAKLSPRPASCRPTTTLSKQPRHRPRTGSPVGRPLRPTPTLVNVPLDLLVCPPPAPPPRCDLRLGLEFSAPRPPRLVVPELSVAPTTVRRRSSLAPAQTAPTAVVMRSGSVTLPSPPVNIMAKKKRESLAQRTLRRTFERTPRGAQVKVLGAHAAVRMMSAMNETTELEDEAAVAASVIVVGEDEPEDVCMADSWVELNPAPISPVSPIIVEPSHSPKPEEDMEWSMIDEDECRSGA
ncbi:hypothetical protein FS749_007447 [Ceratobasidium sp. UAMH 11750]|nr:hypothetical protein FS749_007447 [Ceratobasidium sp. UAMH 11750]